MTEWIDELNWIVLSLSVFGCLSLALAEEATMFF